MKKLRIPGAAALASYLLGCFWAADFNIATWTVEMRFVIMVMMGISAIAALFVTEVMA